MPVNTKTKLITILKFLPILFASGLFLIPGVLRDPKTPQQSINSINQSINDLAKPDNSAKQNENQMIALLQARKDRLIQAIQNDPSILAKSALPKEITDKLTGKEMALVETSKTLTGKLQVKMAETKNGPDQTFYQLELGSGKYSTLYFVKQPENLKSVSQATVTGMELDSTVVLASGASVQSTGAPILAATSTGAKKVLTILINFSDAANPFNATQVNTEMYNAAYSTNNYYKENSYNQLSMSGDVVGPYTVPYSSTSSCSDYGQAWTNAADQDAASAGVNLANYDLIEHVVPNNNNCGFIGVADAPGSWSLFVGYNWSPLYAHELGHNYGMGHASTWDCGNSTLGTSCTYEEYGDYSDAMGQAHGTYPVHFNAAHKIAEGWIPSANVQTIDVTNSSGGGTFNVYEDEDQTVNTQAIKIPKNDTGQYYYFGYRQPVGFDAGINMSGAADFTSGTTATIGDSPTFKSYLLDFHPPVPAYYSASTPLNAALHDGETFTDPYNGIKVTQVSHNSSYVTLTVQVLTYTITASAGANGSISPVGVTTLNHTQSQAYTITPDAGYKISDVLVDGASVGAVSTYTFSNPTANHTISASFVQLTPDHVVISPTAPQTLTPTQTAQFTGMVQDKDNYDIPYLSVTWSGADASGLFTANIPGTYNVTASYNSLTSPPTIVNVNPTTMANVYRFYNPNNGDHFYTDSETEKNNIIANIPDYSYEGIAFKIDTTANNASPLYRFYKISNKTHVYVTSDTTKNAYLAQPTVYAYEGVAFNVSTTSTDTQPIYRLQNNATGNYIDTASVDEKNAILAKWPNDYTYIGIAYYIYGNANPGTPVYRFYNMINYSHFFTTSSAEKDHIIATWPYVYYYEGTAYDMHYASGANTAPLYRFYSAKNNYHFFTSSSAEKDSIIANMSSVYTYEGVAYYVSNSSAGAAPVYRFCNKVNGSHFWTASASEKDHIIATWPDVYTYEGIGYYLPY